MYNFNNVTLETKHIIIIIPFVPSPALIMVLGSVISFLLTDLVYFRRIQRDKCYHTYVHTRVHARAGLQGGNFRWQLAVKRAT